MGGRGGSSGNTGRELKVWGGSGGGDAGPRTRGGGEAWVIGGGAGEKRLGGTAVELSGGYL